MTQFLSCSGLLRRLRRGGGWIWSTISANCGHHRSTTGSPQCHKRIMVSGGSTECAKSERRLSWAGPPKAGPAKAGASQLSPSCPACHQQGAGLIRGAKHLFIWATVPLLGNTNTNNFGNTQHSFFTFLILTKLIFVENLYEGKAVLSKPVFPYVMSMCLLLGKVLKGYFASTTPMVFIQTMSVITFRYRQKKYEEIPPQKKRLHSKSQIGSRPDFFCTKHQPSLLESGSANLRNV